MGDHETSIDQLAEWNRLNKQNHENAMAGQMYVAMLTRFPEQLGNYAAWFSAGVGAVVVLLISNVDKVAPYLGERAYARAIVAFTISVGVGAVCKFIGIVGATVAAMQVQILSDMKNGFVAFDIDAEKIRQRAKEQNRFDVNADFDLPSLLARFQSQLGTGAKLLAAWGAWRASKSDNPVLYQYKWPIRYLYIQAMCCFLAVGFALAGVWCVAGTIGSKAWAQGTSRPEAARSKTPAVTQPDAVETSKP